MIFTLLALALPLGLVLWLLVGIITTHRRAAKRRRNLEQWSREATSLSDLAGPKERR